MLIETLLDVPAAAHGSLWVLGLFLMAWGGRRMKREVLLLEQEKQVLVRFGGGVLRGNRRWFFFLALFLVLFTAKAIFGEDASGAASMAVAFAFAMMVRFSLHGHEHLRLRNVEVPSDFRRRVLRLDLVASLGGAVFLATTCTLFWKLEQVL